MNKFPFDPSDMSFLKDDFNEQEVPDNRLCILVILMLLMSIGNLTPPFTGIDQLRHFVSELNDYVQKLELPDIADFEVKQDEL